MSKSEESTDDDYKYLMECETNNQISKSDRIRSKLFQLNSLQNTLNECVFNKLRLNLMNELSQEIDRNDGKNSYLNASQDMSDISSRDQKHNEWNSRLITLSEEQIFKRFNIKKRNINQIKSKQKSIVLKTEFNENNDKSDANDVEMNDISIVETIVNKVPKTDLFNRVGIFNKLNDNSASEPKRIASQIERKSPLTKTYSHSPTRVSGIFKKNNNNNSQNNMKSDNKSVDNSNNSSRIFMTGLEKKLVDDVKKGSINRDNAKKVLNNVRQQPFKNPLKAETSAKSENELISDERLKNIDPKMIALIESEIISNLEPIEWSKIAGLEFAKRKIHEIAILPLQRPDFFSGIRNPPKGILLFGPPGNGKTLIGRCIASQTKSTFFSITVSSLTSKWIGEGEKMIKAMFTVARCKQPAVIFIDEIDSLLKTRCDSEHESTRRMKTEFLVQFDGVSTDKNERLLIIGATNRPHELDDAARRRLSAKLYIPLPEREARKEIIKNCINSEKHYLTDEQIDDLSLKTEGYSGADMRDLCRESAMEAFRESFVVENFNEIDRNDIRGISYEDFLQNLNLVKPSVSSDDLNIFEEWNQKYGTTLAKSSKTISNSI